MRLAKIGRAEFCDWCRACNIPPANAIRMAGALTLESPMVLDGLLPDRGVDGMQITATHPDGSVEPLLWLYEYKKEHKHAFLLRKPLSLPAGTVIRGVPKGASIILLPA